MTWPDPVCNGPHKEGEKFRPFQHTQECKDSMPKKAKRTGEIPPEENDPVYRAFLEDNIITRGRAAGAF